MSPKRQRRFKMKKVLVHAKAGFVSIVKIENGKVLVKKGHPIFEMTSNGTIGNAMANLSIVLNEVATQEGEYEIATIGMVADKINSDLLVKEYRAGTVLSTKRNLTALEKEVYESLITSIGMTYGKVLVKSEKYVAKTVRAGQTPEQAEWAVMFETATKHLDKMIAEATKQAPEMEVVFEDDEDEISEALNAC